MIKLLFFALLLGSVMAKPITVTPLRHYPVAAEIIPTKEFLAREYVSGLIGNVNVIFNDGHRERWTFKGSCMYPRVSPRGVVGWDRLLDYPDEEGSIRICSPDGVIKDIGVNFPFIYNWNFSRDGRFIITLSAMRHGPWFYARYDVQTGALIGKNIFQYSPDLPAWTHQIGDLYPN